MERRTSRASPLRPLHLTLFSFSTLSFFFSNYCDNFGPIFGSYTWLRPCHYVPWRLEPAVVVAHDSTCCRRTSQRFVGQLPWAMADSLAALSPRQWRSQLLATTRAKIWLAKHKHPTSPIYMAKHVTTRLEKEKSIFDHPTIVSVWFWPSNSKIGYLRPSNF
jgi:hypothetical protein